MIEWK